MHNVRITIITSLFRGEKYLRSYLDHLGRISNPGECELILVHNDPTEEETRILSDLPNLEIDVVHLIVAREPLYSSWNRAVKVSRGEYLTIWNVDDVRLPTAIEYQANALDKNADAFIAYGNFTVVNEYGSTSGLRVTAPEFNRKDKSFLRQHHIGPFPMWRKKIHHLIGYFDEQFRLVADLDFQIRAAQKLKLVKVDRHLGYYLEGTASNLSSNFKLQDSEHTALHLRYGNYDLIFLTYLFNLNRIKVSKYKWFDNYYPVDEWSGSQKIRKMYNFPLIFVSIIRFPRHLAQKYLRQTLRKYLKHYSITLSGKSSTKSLA